MIAIERAHDGRSLPGQLDEDVFEAGAVDLNPQHVSARRQRRHEREHARFLVLERDVQRVRLTCTRSGWKRGDHRLEPSGRRSKASVIS